MIDSSRVFGAGRPSRKYPTFSETELRDRGGAVGATGFTYAHADFEVGSPAEGDRFVYDGAVETTPGVPTIEEPEWTERAASEERDPIRPA